MKMRKVAVVVVLLGSALGIFQNCSEVQYAALEPDSDVTKLAATNENTLIVSSPTAPMSSSPGSPQPGGSVSMTHSSSPRPEQISVDERGDERESSSSFKCHLDHLRDIQVHIKAVRLGLIPAKSVLGVQSLEALAQGFRIESDRDQHAAYVRLELEEDKNQLIGVDGQSHELKTPSGQTSGLKIPLRGQNFFKAGVPYLVQFELDPETQLVRAGDQCLLKPVLKMVHVEAVAKSE